MAAADDLLLHRELYRLARSRQLELAQGLTSPNAVHPYLRLSGCRVLHPEEGRYWPGAWRVDVDLASGRIARVQPISESPGVAGTPTVELVCKGLTLMPGLCDAHVHVTACSADLTGLTRLPESLVSARASVVLEEMLSRGFTTVRDCGGADHGLAAAVEEGTLLGPRVLFTGHALSQTGGHGDFRGAGDDCLACGAALRGIWRVCDGDAEVRRAVRDELRKGAHCIKVMASGGVSSPTDALENTQFSMGELRAIVEEAEASRTYVCAHAYTAEAVHRAVEAGCRSIEHGNYAHRLRPDIRVNVLAEMASRGVFLVPTTVTYKSLRAKGTEAGLPAALQAKLGDLVEAGLECMAAAHSHGVKMAFGSDLLGTLHSWQSEEFNLRAQVLPAAEVVRSATTRCAELFMESHKRGAVAEGYYGDLILVSGDPLSDAGVLADPDNIVAVLKGGVPVATRSQVGALVARELRGAFVEGPVDVVMKPAASERSGLSGGVAMKEDDEVGSG